MIGLPSEYCEILMGQPDHLEMGACHQLRGHTYTLWCHSCFKVIGLPSELCYAQRSTRPLRNTYIPNALTTVLPNRPRRKVEDWIGWDLCERWYDGKCVDVNIGAELSRILIRAGEAQHIFCISSMGYHLNKGEIEPPRFRRLWASRRSTFADAPCANCETK